MGQGEKLKDQSRRYSCSEDLFLYQWETGKAGAPSKTDGGCPGLGVQQEHVLLQRAYCTGARYCSKCFSH